MFIFALSIILSAFQALFCDNLRLSGLSCINDDADNSTNNLPIWRTPYRETNISEICQFIVVLSGLTNNDAETAVEDDESLENINLTNYKLQPILSPSPNYDKTKLADVQVLSEISLSSVSPFKTSTTGDLTIDMIGLTVGPSDMCGIIYLIVSLEKAEKLIVSSIGSLAKPLKVLCPRESDAQLKLQIQYSNGSLFDPLSSYLMINQEGVISLKGMTFIIINEGQSSFRRRCGLSALQAIAFLVPINRNESLDWLDINGYQIFNFAHGYHVNGGNENSRLILDSRGVCSPFIQAKTSVPVNSNNKQLMQLMINSPRHPHLSLPLLSDLVVILDPLHLDEAVSSSAPSSSETRAEKEKANSKLIFKFPVKLQDGKKNSQSENRFMERCEVIRSYESNMALIFHCSETSQRSSFFIYDIITKRLTRLENNEESLTLANILFYQKWLIKQTLNQLPDANCPKSIDDENTNSDNNEGRKSSIVDRIRALALDLASLLGQIDVETIWQEEQLDKLSLSAQLTGELIKQLITGDLKPLFPQAIKLTRSLISRSFSAAERLDKYDETFFGTIRRVIEDIIEAEPPNDEASNLVPRRIRLFMGRLVRDGASKVIQTFPGLADRVSFLEDLRQLLIWIIEDVYWDFELPKELDKQLILTIKSNSPDEFSKQLIDLSELADKWSDIETDEETVMESVSLFRLILIKTIKENIWSRWTEIWKSWLTDFLDPSVRWIFLEGLPGEPKISVERCYQIANQILINQNNMPDWLRINISKEVLEKGEVIGHQQQNLQQHQVQFKSDGLAIFRGDRELLTGTTFWTRIMLCSCNKTLINQCTL